ncbi:molybdate ABC transporter permease [Sphaerisporangium siamense]|uniref:Molybdate transport system permease protein n=1 Tax=Sphaerisporangium siamense TaxID=795645 RepID=A0A7W7DC22_9ACTN|nr:ABC transporter permease subunit [Sphaerisporangium siamense]MBB4704052.1 molybdate transport system permease protein [Sphaerisporangium siamense]GII82527.1 molybdate ABC transporter permease [Sphaerisporangium siamense]
MKASSTFAAMAVLRGRRRRPADRSAGGRAGGSAVPLLPAALALTFLALPLAALLSQAPWPSLAEPGVLTALRSALVTALLATLVCLPLGVPLAWTLARAAVRGERALRALVAVPIVIPPAVAVVAVPLAMGGTGGPQATGPGTGALVAAAAFTGLPFLVAGVERALRAADPGLEEAAAMLGGSRWTVFRRVTLPAAAPGIAVGAVLCWARALGEYGAAAALEGNALWGARVMPPEVARVLHADPPAALTFSLALLTASAATLACLRRHWTTAP